MIWVIKSKIYVNRLSMSRLIIFLLSLMLACESSPPARGVRLEGNAAGSDTDSIFLYEVNGLSRDQLASASVGQQGDSLSWALTMDSLDQGWYYLGVAPNQLTKVFLAPGELVTFSGQLAAQGLLSLLPSAHHRWIETEQAFLRISQAVTSTWKMAIINLEDDNPNSYLDYASLTLTEYSRLEDWMDSLYMADAFLADEYRLRLHPPFLPDYGKYSEQGAFEWFNDYFQAVLTDLGPSAANYPGLREGMETWLDLQHRSATWAAPAIRDRRIDSLLSRAEPGSAFHQELLATVISVLDGWNDTSVARYASQYLDLYPGSRRMEAYLSGRIRMMEGRLRQQRAEPRLYDSAR